MKPFAAILSVCLLFCAGAQAAETKPSDESIRRLLTVTEAGKMLDAAMSQVGTMMENMMKQATQGKTVTPEQQKAMADLRAKSAAIMQEELSWQKMEPLYMRIYRDSFSQEEVDGMLAFYATPAGKAVIKKMPLVMQNTMAVMQERMGPVMVRIQQQARETMGQAKAAPAK